jgi:uncharacterized protein YqjF (DUF2071 family)
VEKAERIDYQSPLDVFLTARFRLYSTYSKRLITAAVWHRLWELNRVRVIELEENVRRTMGVEFESFDFLAHHSPGVDTKIGRPQFA